MNRKKIGILGGGQLGMFICQIAKKMNIQTSVFSEIDDFSAKKFCDNFFIASYNNQKTLNEFLNSSDIFTIETENIPKNVLWKIKKKKKLFPSSKIVEIAQNRLLEKKILNSLEGIKTAKYKPINNFNQLKLGLEDFNFNAILKSCEMGYDGKNQFLINKNNIQKYKNKSLKNHILEELLDFKKEISVIVCRDSKKNVITYPPVENIHKNSILHKTNYPAKINLKTKNEAEKISKKIASDLDVIGNIAVEMFVMKDEKILVNEIAPRPHNSGHWTIDCCKFNQFENLIYAITENNVKKPIPKKRCSMINLIGDEYKNINILKRKFRCYDYYKTKIKPNRKMGHYIIEQN